MIDKHYTNCPLCNEAIIIEPNSIYPNNYPTYRCPIIQEDLKTYHKSHYVKYFSSDWSCTHYAESIHIGDYKIFNHFIFPREGKPNKKDYSVIYKVIGYEEGYAKKKRIIRDDVVKLDKPEIMIVELEKLFE